MSIEYLNKAFNSDVRPSTLKFVLVALCDFANEEGVAYPTIETLSRKTGQNRKTILSNLHKLVEQNVITDTGERVGKTRRVPVWRILIGNLKQTRKRDHSKDNRPDIGTVTEDGNSTSFSSNEPKNGTVKQSQKRDIEPSLSLTTNRTTRRRRASSSESGKNSSARRRQVAKQIPQDWEPGDRVFRWAKKNGHSQELVESHVDEFVAFWSDSGQAKKSWNATYINNLKRIVEYESKQRSGQRSHGSRGFWEDFSDAIPKELTGH